MDQATHKHSILDLEANLIDGWARLVWELLGEIFDDDCAHLSKF